MFSILLGPEAPGGRKRKALPGDSPERAFGYRRGSNHRKKSSVSRASGPPGTRYETLWKRGHPSSPRAGRATQVIPPAFRAASTPYFVSSKTMPTRIGVHPPAASRKMSGALASPRRTSDEETNGEKRPDAQNLQDLRGDGLLGSGGHRHGSFRSARPSRRGLMGGKACSR